jgi:Cu-Zn family superoxide dismutase
MLKYRLTLPILLTTLCLASCTRTDGARDGTEFEDESIRTAVAEIHPLDGSTVHGTVTFTELDDAVEITGTVNGLRPGSHGFHIHSGVLCTDPGEHFNPDNEEHGGPNDAERHLGDLGNLETGTDSSATFEMTNDMIELVGEDAIVGHALIVHQGEDDYTTQPSGDSGPQVGCGIIELR